MPVSLFPDPDVLAPLEAPYERLAELRREIERDEPDPVVREAYLDYIDDVRLNIELIRAGGDQDAATYERLNDELYGRPGKTVYEDACVWMVRDATAAMVQAADQTLVECSREVLRVIPQTSGDYQRLLPSDETFARVREAHFRTDGFFDTLFGEAGLPSEPYITQQTGDAICQAALDRIGADYEIVEAHNHIWSVSREPAQLLRPVGYRLARDEFIGIVAHEIGSHILESANGARQPLKLLEMGLAGFVHGNEGRALLREQIVYEDIATAVLQPAWEFNLAKHLAVSFALGYHDGRRYQLPELYDTLFRLYHFWRVRRFPYETNNEQVARHAAWHMTVRILKGTDGTGGCYQKDYVYLEGNVKLWQLAADDPEIILLGDQGKFNLLDPKQRELMARFARQGNQ